MKPKAIEEFVKTHAEFMTSGDMAEELDIQPSYISAACKKVGVKALSKTQQQKNYILDVFKKNPFLKLPIN